MSTKSALSSRSSHTTPSTAGRELLLELKRHQSHVTKSSSGGGATAAALPAYNTQTVRQCFEDLQSSVAQLNDEVQASRRRPSALEEGKQGQQGQQGTSSNSNSQSQSQTTGSHHHHHHNHREPKKPSMAARPSILWHYASIQRHKRCLLAYHKHRLECAGGIKSLSPDHEASWTLTNAAELDFVRSYQDLRSHYADAVGLDLGVPPPGASHSLQVRCVAELGQVVLDSGRSVTLTKGSVLFLPRSDVVDFLQAGTMQLLEGEEVDF